MHIWDKICQEVKLKLKSANQSDIQSNTTYLNTEPNLAILTEVNIDNKKNWDSDLDNFIAQWKKRVQ